VASEPWLGEVPEGVGKLKGIAWRHQNSLLLPPHLMRGKTSHTGTNTSGRSVELNEIIPTHV